jgi:ABC-2 type transport system permease protein
MARKKRNNNTDLLYELVKTSFMLKYNGSFLGFIWVLLKPFAQFLLLYFVFSGLRGNDTTENFAIYLLSGLIIFEYFREGIFTGIQSLLDKAHIILKVNFNRTLAVYSTLFLALINFVINFLIVVVFALFTSIDMTFTSFLYFVFIMIILSILMVGVTFFTSIITVMIRDLQHIAEVGMQLLFYATPIFYQIEIIPQPLRSILEKNPLYIIMKASRAALIDGQIIHEKSILLIAALSLVVIFLGYHFFKSKVVRIAEKF